MKRRVSSTRSPLANPRTPVHRLAAQLQDCLYFPDPGPLYAVCGALASNTMRGHPVWLMLIGPPESGKTELLKPLLQIQGVRECGDLSGKAALLSATKAKEVAADATGGLLKDMPRGEDGVYRGCLIMLDFARTVLAGNKDESRATLGAIGMIHDQHYQREVGTDGGRTISFNGRLGFLAACTDVMDHPDHQQANAEMGERCIYYRYPRSDGYHEIQSALDQPDGAHKSKRIKELFLTWAEECELDWSDLIPPRLLTDSEKRMLGAVSSFCAKGRSGVTRDRWNKNEISGVNRSALGPRIANTLAQLLRGMERIGCTPEEQVSVIRQCAMDSLPAVRMDMIRGLQEGHRSLSDLADFVGLSNTTAKRVLEDLRVHGLTAADRTDGTGQWFLSETAKELLRMGWDWTE